MATATGHDAYAGYTADGMEQGQAAQYGWVQPSHERDGIRLHVMRQHRVLRCPQYFGWPLHLSVASCLCLISVPDRKPEQGSGFIEARQR